SEKMNVHVPRAAMSLKLEMMMLEVAQAMTHFGLARPESARPEHTSLAINLDLRRDRRELWIDDEFRAQCAGSEFRSCQVQIVLLLESMIRELVAARHSNA